MYPQQDSNLQNRVSKTRVYTNSTIGAYVEVREGFEPTYQGFADLDFTHQTPDLKFSGNDDLPLLLQFGY